LINSNKYGMMNKLQLFIFLVCICMLAGCTEEEENSGIRLIEGTASGQTVFADETTTDGDIHFTTDGAWTAEVTEASTKAEVSSVSWVTLDKYSGNAAGEYTITVFVRKNYTGADRKAYIRITCGSSITITIEQKAVTESGDVPVNQEPTYDGEAPYVTVEEQEVVLPAVASGRFFVNFKSNLMEEPAIALELPGEEEGILYNPDHMYQPDIATMSIGQGIAVTPLQMLRAICAIANGGELLQPYIIDKIVMPDGRVLRQGQKKVVRRVMSEEVAAQMRGMMEQVVAAGGGKAAGIKGYRIAGKTGTAEKLAETGGYAAGKYIASFVGFVPADKPQYAMLIMLDTPQGAFYGSQVSAPVFRDTLQQILVAKGIQPSSSEGLPSFEQHVRNNPAVNSTVPPPAKMPQMEILADGKIKLPDFSGLDMRQTAELIQQGRLVLVPHGSGRARKQSQPPGTVVSEGTKLEIWFE
jgi:hypothetical protein